MPGKAKSRYEPETSRLRLRRVILGGGSLLLDQLDAAELEAMQQMLFDGEAEIINSACRPYPVKKIDRTII